MKVLICSMALIALVLLLWASFYIDAQDSSPGSINKESIPTPLFITGTITISSPACSILIKEDSILFKGKKGIITIYPDTGKVTRQNCDADEAAQIFWNAVDDMRKLYPPESSNIQPTKKPNLK